MTAIRVFVGTDQRMRKAELVLEHSIRKHASQPVEIHWMRANDPGFRVEEHSTWGENDPSWSIGRPPGTPYGPGKPGRWATDFTCFRFFVPELCNFEGFAIYLDVDMMLFADIAELWNYRQPGKLVSTSRLDVFVADCSAFRDWIRSEEAKGSGFGFGVYQGRLGKRWVKNGIPDAWDTLDRWDERAKLVHFTQMRTQPWKPWPEVFRYPDHPDPAAVEKFWELYEEATSCASTS